MIFDFNFGTNVDSIVNKIMQTVQSKRSSSSVQTIVTIMRDLLIESAGYKASSGSVTVLTITDGSADAVEDVTNSANELRSAYASNMVAVSVIDFLPGVAVAELQALSGLNRVFELSAIVSSIQDGDFDSHFFSQVFCRQSVISTSRVESTVESTAENRLTSVSNVATATSTLSSTGDVNASTSVTQTGTSFELPFTSTSILSTTPTSHPSTTSSVSITSTLSTTSSLSSSSSSTSLKQISGCSVLTDQYVVIVVDASSTISDASFQNELRVASETVRDLFVVSQDVKYVLWFLYFFILYFSFIISQLHVSFV